MDIDKVLVNDFANRGIFGDEISELQAPGTPIATHLTDDELAFGLSFRYSLVYLLDGINILVIHFLQRFLSVCRQGKENGYYCQKQFFLHMLSNR